MKTKLLSAQAPFENWRLGFIRSLKSFFTLFLFSTLLFSSKTFAQIPTACGSLNCTSNDVQVVSAYISGPNDMPIDCGSSDPFNNAELHLIISSNTQRIGISLSATLNTTDASNNIIQSYAVSNCFTGITLNNGSNNNLVYQLSSQLSGVQCGPNFSLANVFISWGTGNTDFCNGSHNPSCPTTPAKCRFVPGETIPVTVKLEVDFSWMAGVCAKSGNSLSLDFTPSVITQQSLTPPLTFTWDFGDGSAHTTTTATGTTDAELAAAHIVHTYLNAGPYTVTLTATDASSFSSPPAVHNITVIACCNVSTPTATTQNPGCGETTGTVTVDNPVSGITYTLSGNHLYTADASGVFSGVLPGTYSFEASDGTCTATGTDVTVNNPPLTPAAPILSVANNCGSSTITANDKDGSPIDASGLTWSNGAAGNPITVTDVTAITATIKVGDCTSDASEAVTPAPKTIPVAPSAIGASRCGMGTVQLTASGCDGGTLTWYDASTNGTALGTGSPFTTPSVSSTTDFWVSCTNNGCEGTTAKATATVNPLPSCTITNKTSAGSQTAGVGQSVDFGGPAAPIGSTYSYQWSFTGTNTAGGTFSGGASTATTQNVMVTTTSTGSYTLQLKVTDNTYPITYCNSTCTYPVTVNTSNGYYTYTQGYYSSTGTSCTPVGGFKGSLSLIQYALDNMDGTIGNSAGQLKLGSTGHSFTANYADASKLRAIMPGGGTAAKLSGDLTVSTVPLKNGKINNVLLSQAITLALNTNIQGDALKTFVLKTGYLTTQKGDLSTCPATKVVPCSKDASSISSLQIATSTGMKTWIAGKSVNDLLTLASNALGGAALPSGVSLSDITNAIDAINRSFDGGRFFLGYYTTAQTCSSISSVIASSAVVNRSITPSGLTVKAYPNPYTNRVNFKFTSPVSGTATLTAYDLLGQKLAVVYQGKVDAGVERMVTYTVQATNRVAMMYKLTIGDKTYHGMLIPIK